MSVPLDPLITAKLTAFAIRRRVLIAQRGACAGVLSLILSMCVVSLIDWLIFLSDGARWLLSTSAYAIVLGVIWVTCLRLILRLPRPAQIARLIEAAQPGLREDLISAVELGSPVSADTWDSIAFRRLLQQDVAHRMATVHVIDLLPARLIKRWRLGAGLALAVCFVLLVLPGLHFGRRIARALLPMADIERVALTRIAIVRPTPASVAVPQGEPVEVAVELDGPVREDKVMLETFRKGQVRQQMELRPDPAGERRFSTTVRVDRESLQYRIRANDAQTQKHLIVSRQRPHVVAFHKTYNYPGYTRMAATTETDKSGDLAALEGSRVDLVIETSEPIALAHLAVDKGGVTEKTVLLPEIDALPTTAAATVARTLGTRLRGSLTLDRSGNYRVYLVAAETDFENKFNPDYTLTAHPDLPPTVRITEPAEAILAPPDEIVRMSGRADDDWALERIEQHVRVNGNEWQPTQLAVFEDVVKQHVIELQWDLYPLRLKTGDEVQIKFVAVDRKGSRSESKPLRVVISAPDFDPKRLERLAAARQAHNALAELARKADSLSESVHAALAGAEQQVGSPLQTQQALLTANEALGQFIEDATRSNDAVKRALQHAHPGREVDDLVLAGRLVASAVANATHSLRLHLVDAEAAAGKTPLVDALQATMTNAKLVQRTSRVAADLFRTLIATDHIALAATDLLNTLKMIDRTVAQTESRGFREGSHRRADEGSHRLAKRGLAAASQLELLGGVLDELAALVDSGKQKQVERIQQQIAAARSRMNSVGASGTAQNPEAADPRALVEMARTQRDLGGALGETIGLLRGMIASSDGARRRMLDSCGPMYGPAMESLACARRLNEMKRALGDRAARGDLDMLERDAQAAKRQRAATLSAFELAVAQLESRAILEEAQPEADSRFVADLNRASHAMAALRERATQGGNDEATALADVERLTSALQVLTVGQCLDELTPGVQALADLERNGPHRGDRAGLLVNNPQDWTWCEAQYDQLARDLLAVDAHSKATRVLNTSRSSAEFKAVSEEMRLRPEQHRDAKSVATQAAKLANDLRIVRQELQEEFYKARNVLDELTVGLSQMLADAASRTAARTGFATTASEHQPGRA